MRSFNLLWRLMSHGTRLGEVSMNDSVQMTSPRARSRRSTRLKRVKISRQGNPCFTSYELDQPLGESNTYFVFEWRNGEVLPRGLFSDSQENLPVEPFMLTLAEKLYEVEDVIKHRHPELGNGIKMNAYQVSVVKTNQRRDEDIEADILDIIAAAFGTSASSLKVTLENNHSQSRYANNA